MDHETAKGLAERLYRALAAWDLETLQALLHPAFEGRTTAGLPFGLGGRYEGPQAMIREFWARIGRNYDAKAVPEHFALGDDGCLAVQGRYVGRARKGRALDAEYVHFLSFEDERIRTLHQITDSQRWADALVAEPVGD